MAKTMYQIAKEVDINEWYRPSQISKNEWLYGFQGKSAYDAILDLIKKNKIKAVDFGRGQTCYYRVLGKELMKYLLKL